MSEQTIVDTSVIRLMKARMRVTHEERGIAVISGPWGIGKTTAINAFADHITEGGEVALCAVVKVEPGATKRGATGGAVMRQALEALRALNGKTLGTQLSNATWTLRQQIYSEIIDLFGDETFVPFTFIFDEAQYLSREAIEMLRYWNDRDRTTTPFPVGLIFVGNNEFAMAENLGGESVLTGAVRSRLLFEEPLSYDHLDDADLTLFCQSRGISEAGAISRLVAHFGKTEGRGRRPAPKKDLRAVERLIVTLHRRAGEAPVTAAVVDAVLNPQF